MMLRMGTRTLQGFRKEHPASRTTESGLTRDVKMTKLVTTSATFTASDGKITGSAADFAAFAVNDPILIQGSNLNDGERTVTGVDGASQAFLVLDFVPKNEGPVTVTVRTP